MAEMKYDKYIVKKAKQMTPPPGVEIDPERMKRMSQIMSRVAYLDDEVVPGSFYVECCWFWKGSEGGHGAHTHDWDEVLTFFGTNPEAPHDLCGEVELWLDDEKHIITESCIVYIPKGFKHCPMIVRKVDRPIFHFSAGITRMFTEESIQ